MATMAGMYAVYHGSEGIREIAQNGRYYAHLAAEVFTKNGFALKTNISLILLKSQA